MKFSVGTNWDPELISGLSRFGRVEDVYAKLAEDMVGGGRPAYVVPKVTSEEVAAHIEDCHRHGIEFTYLLNASCLYGREFDEEWRREFAKMLDGLVDMGVDRVTVAIPYLIEVVKARHPRLKVNVSSFAEVNSVERARRFARMGADEVTFDFLSMQRDFKLMAAMVKSVETRFQVLGNHTCLHHCPSRTYHANLSSHGSQQQRRGEGAILDYCVLECLNTKLTDPSELIRSQWIRPEDLWHYEEIGIDKVKLVDRSRSTEWILKVVEAYVNRRTPGDNLIEVLNAVGSGGLPFADFGEFLKADAARPELAQTLGALAMRQFLLLDNRQLDGFLDRVKEIDCRSTDCDACGYCAEVASRAVRIHPDLEPELAKRFPAIREGLQQYLTGVYTGSIFEDRGPAQE
ncbi:MAG: U32 family peptidase [Planctomycetota bacterium]